MQTLIETAYRYLQCIVFKVFLNKNLLWFIQQHQCVYLELKKFGQYNAFQWEINKTTPGWEPSIQEYKNVYLLEFFDKFCPFWLQHLSNEIISIFDLQLQHSGTWYDLTSQRYPQHFISHFSCVDQWCTSWGFPIDDEYKNRKKIGNYVFYFHYIIYSSE